jgi:hypothetical protein
MTAEVHRYNQKGDLNNEKKNLPIVVFAISLICSLASGCLSQQAAIPTTSQARQAFLDKMAATTERIFEDMVLQHDSPCHCLIVKIAKGDLLLQENYSTFMEGYDLEKGLKIGSKIKGTYKRVGSLEIHRSKLRRISDSQGRCFDLIRSLPRGKPRGMRSLKNSIMQLL